MATASVQKGTDPAGSHVATDSFTEDAVTKHAQRVGVCNAVGKNLSAASSASGPSAISVGAGANGTQLFAANTSRVGFLIHNASAVAIFIGFNATGLTISNGIRIFSGGSFAQQGIGLYQGVIHGIVASATADVRVQEW